MIEVPEIIGFAKKRKQKTLSEYDSKLILSAYGIPVVREVIVRNLRDAKESALGLGYPIVLKICSSEVTHKTEKELVMLNLHDEYSLEEAFKKLKKKNESIDGEFLVQKMISGIRELVVGMIRDPQFGPCVMFGLGGVYTEVIKDVTFRVAPIERYDALEMMREIRGSKILDAFRGMPPVDLDSLSQSLIALGQIGLENTSIQQIDINPVIIQGGKPIAVDALVVLEQIPSEKNIQN